MRSLRHWTPKYVADRVMTAAYERLHPNEPWLTPAANAFLRSFLRPTDLGAEFGSGRSTIWFAERVGSLVSVEDDTTWFVRVQQMIRERGFDHVDYYCHPSDVPQEEAADSAYVAVGRKLADCSLDFALVDGAYRDHCAQVMLSRIKPGGLLVIDNVNWFLPSDSRSPDSRSRRDGPNGPVWAEVFRRLQSWRVVWTTSGVTDTAIFIKPCSSAPEES